MISRRAVDFAILPWESMDKVLCQGGQLRDWSYIILSEPGGCPKKI